MPIGMADALEARAAVPTAKAVNAKIEERIDTGVSPQGLVQPIRAIGRTAPGQGSPQRLKENNKSRG
jgi:hypothetical protein